MTTARWLMVIFGICAIVFYSSLRGGVWGNHEVFIAAYVMAAAYCLYRERWIAFATSLSLVLLRWLIMDNVTGLPLQFSSVLFIGLFLALCMTKAGDLPPLHNKIKENV